jgi:hypothetical protein
MIVVVVVVAAVVHAVVLLLLLLPFLFLLKNGTLGEIAKNPGFSTFEKMRKKSHYT